MLEERDRRVLFEILFEEAQEGSWEEAQSCLEALARKQVERELADVQRGIEANPTGPAMRELLTKKQALMRRLGHADCGVYAEVIAGGAIGIGDAIVAAEPELV